MKQKGRHTTYKSRLRRVLKEKWESKVMHGQYIRNTDKQLISQEDTFLWLLMGDPKSEMESEITAAQNHTLQTKHHTTKILQTQKADADYVNNMTIGHTALACCISAKEQCKDMIECVLNYTLTYARIQA